MKKALLNLLIIFTFSIKAQAQNSKGYARQVAEKRFDSTAIPAGFKNYKGTLLVSSDIDGRRGKKTLENLMEGYEGKYEIVKAGKDLAEDFPNASKDFFILHIVSGIKLEKHGKDSYSHLIAHMHLSNRFTKEEFKLAFNTADYWTVNMQYLLDILNEKLHEKK